MNLKNVVLYKARQFNLTDLITEEKKNSPDIKPDDDNKGSGPSVIILIIIIVGSTLFIGMVVFLVFVYIKRRQAFRNPPPGYLVFSQ